MNGVFLSLVGAATSTAAVPLPLEKPHRVAIFALRSTPELAATARRTTEELLIHLGRIPGLIAIGEAEMQVLLSHEKDKVDMLACPGDEACLAKLNAAVQADKLITGHVGAWGDGLLCTLTLSDVTTASVERGDSVVADDVNQLLALVRGAADRLIRGHAQPSRAAGLEGLREGTKVAVLNLEAYGAPPSVAENLTELLSLELKRIQGLGVISRDEIKAMLQYEVDKQVLSCKQDIACIIEIGGALGVEYLVTGAVGRTEDTWVVHLKLLDTGKAEVIARVAETFRGPETELSKTLRVAALELLGTPPAGAGTIAISTGAGDATVSIDGEPPLSLPFADPLARSAGKHTLSLRAPGYLELEREFYVDRGLLTRLELEPEEVPTEWYEEWWPWTIGGVVVAGAATAIGVFFALEQDAPVPDPTTGSVDVRVR